MVLRVSAANSSSSVPGRHGSGFYESPPGWATHVDDVTGVATDPGRPRLLDGRDGGVYAFGNTKIYR
jgi:hypothetical protein